jgi:endonuclease YncB( thermonuclease family)
VKVFGPYRGVVNRVYDGDTVHIDLDLGFDLTVHANCRVYGINAPELTTDAGKQSAAFARTLLPTGAPVMVTSHGWDKYSGRIDAAIQLPDLRDFATVMVKEGFAEIKEY